MRNLNDKQLRKAVGGNTSSLPPLPYDGIRTIPATTPTVPPGPSPQMFVEDVQGGVA